MLQLNGTSDIYGIELTQNLLAFRTINGSSEILSQFLQTKEVVLRMS